MTNVLEFLHARLDDDEAIANNALHADGTEPGVWITEHHKYRSDDEPDTCHIAEDRTGDYWTVASEVYIPNAEHMARHDPARVLRDVAAKRATLDTLFAAELRPTQWSIFAKVIEPMAAVYSDHPDYQKEWAL